MRAVRTSNQTISSNVTTTVTFQTEDYDINNTFDPVTGIFTPPQAGYYVIKASVNWSSSNTTTAIRSIRLVKNGSTIVEQADTEGSRDMHSSIHTLIHSNGTDNYRIQVHQGSGTNHDILGSTSPSVETTFTAFNLSSYSNETLRLENGGLSWGSITDAKVRAVRTTAIGVMGATVTYTSEEFDIGNNFNQHVGVFTPPQAGYYVILASVQWRGYPSSGRRHITLTKNSSIAIGESVEEGVNGSMSSSIHSVVYSNGTDDYRINVYQNTGTNQDILRASFVAFRIADDGMIGRDGGGISDGNTRIRTRRTSSLSIPSGVSTKVTYSIEDIDPTNEFDPSIGIFSPIRAGYYAIMATIGWGTNNSALGTRGIRLVKKAGAVSEVQKANYDYGSDRMTSNLHTVIYYDGTSVQEFHIEAYQDSGVSHDIDGFASETRFTVCRL